MILEECLTFALMFASGVIAGITATFLLLLGKGSRVARAVFDFLTPPAVGAIFFFALMLSSGGVLCWYAPVAYALGGAVQQLVHKRLSPILCCLVKKLIVPIKSLEKSLEKAEKTGSAVRR